MSSEIRSYVSRYVVPFYFDFENSGYEILRKHFINKTETDNKALGLPKGKWVNAADKETQAEMDIYSYLPSVFLEEKNINKKDISNLGISLEYETSGKLFELEYRYEGKNIAFDCKDLGLLLLRNGIGFIWYETRFKNEISLDEYVGFQHDFKELARTHADTFLKKVTVVKDSTKDPKKVRKEDIETKHEPFCLGEWLSKVIEADSLGIRFWAERKTKQGDGNISRIPDKALLFQYLFVEQMTDHERNNLLFRITNGYNEKYNAPEDIAEKLYKPFGNVCYYVSKAGMACVVKNVDTNEAFFAGQFREKFVRDYFFIYLLLAYQSYSCAHYSRLLTKLPADEELFNEQLMYADKLESLNGEINLFLVKSVFESVSNIHQQNEIYRFGKTALRIEEDIRSLTIGLGALEEMVNDKRKQKEQKEREAEKEEKEERYRKEQARKEAEDEIEEKRDRKINRALSVFGLMVVVSALIDGLNLVDWFMKPRRNINSWHVVICVVIVILTLYLIFNLLRNRNNRCDCQRESQSTIPQGRKGCLDHIHR